MLMLVMSVALASAEEEGGTTAAATGDQAGCIAGYKPATDVAVHSKIDLDIKDIETEMSEGTPEGFLAAAKLYESGKNSINEDKSIRTIKGFGVKSDEPLGKLYTDYPWDPHALVAAALAGKDDTTYGPFAKGSIANKPDARSQIVKKTIKFQIVQLYAVHEIESALAKYAKTGETTTAAAHAWDEFWAFYAGSLEAGNNNGNGPYINAEKRGTYFQTTGTVGNGGVSLVNEKLLRVTQAGRDLTLAAGNLEKLQDAAKCIRAQIKVPVIQGCLQYAYKTDVSSTFEPDDESNVLPNAARKAEMWAFCSAALPFLHDVDPTAAKTVRAEADFTTDDKMPSFKNVLGAFTAKNLNAMGITCKDIGFGNSLKIFVGITCNDGAMSNPYADSSKCADFEAPNDGCDKAGASSSSSSVMSSLLFSLLLSICAYSFM